MGQAVVGVLSLGLGLGFSACAAFTEPAIAIPPCTDYGFNPTIDVDGSRLPFRPFGGDINYFASGKKIKKCRVVPATSWFPVGTPILRITGFSTPEEALGWLEKIREKGFKANYMRKLKASE